MKEEKNQKIECEKPKVIAVFDSKEEKREIMETCSPGNCSPQDPVCLVPGN